MSESQPTRGLPIRVRIEHINGGDCADPTACTLQPNGSLVFSGFVGDAVHVVDANIKSHSMVTGLWARPTNALRFNFDADLFWAESKKSS
jgi:hypothetical protein